MYKKPYLFKRERYNHEFIAGEIKMLSNVKEKKIDEVLAVNGEIVFELNISLV